MLVDDLKKSAEEWKRTERMPVVFIGHGNPMNALYDNTFTRALAAAGLELAGARPRAILVVSAHWLSSGTMVNVTPSPETIYDFYGFPPELYAVSYPAPGAPDLSRETARLLAGYGVKEDPLRGLDHGAWTVLRHMFPDAAVPTYQLSIDVRRPPEYHFELGRHLRALRERGVLILGSGNLVHNLRMIDFRDDAPPFDWAEEFDDVVRKKLVDRDDSALIAYRSLGSASALAIPTNDHYLPMLYTLGAAFPEDGLRFLHEEIQNGSISMRSFRLG